MVVTDVVVVEVVEVVVLEPVGACVVLVTEVVVVVEVVVEPGKVTVVVVEPASSEGFPAGLPLPSVLPESVEPELISLKPLVGAQF